MALSFLSTIAYAQFYYDFEQEDTRTVLAKLELSSLPASHLQVERLTFTPAGNELFGLGLNYGGSFDFSNDNVVLAEDGGLKGELETFANFDDSFPTVASTVIGPLQFFSLSFLEFDHDTIFLHNIDDTALVFIEGDWVGGDGSGFNSTGDVDGDGDRDGFDFLEWQRQFGLTGIVPFSGADATGDGNVTGADLAIWQAGFGLSSGVQAVATVPEPSTLLLSVVFLLRLWTRPASS